MPNFNIIPLTKINIEIRAVSTNFLMAYNSKSK